MSLNIAIHSLSLLSQEHQQKAAQREVHTPTTIPNEINTGIERSNRQKAKDLSRKKQFILLPNDEPILAREVQVESWHPFNRMCTLPSDEDQRAFVRTGHRGEKRLQQHIGSREQLVEMGLASLDRLHCHQHGRVRAGRDSRFNDDLWPAVLLHQDSKIGSRSLLQPECGNNRNILLFQITQVEFMGIPSE